MVPTSTSVLEDMLCDAACAYGLAGDSANRLSMAERALRCGEKRLGPCTHPGPSASTVNPRCGK